MEKQGPVIHSAIVLLAAMLFGTSALAQLPPANQPDMTVDAKAKADAISSLARGLRDAYVFPDVGEQVAKALEERQERGEYSSITSAWKFAETLTSQMYEVAHDKHMRIDYRAAGRPAGPPPGGGGGPEQRRVIARKLNYSFDEVKRLDGNIGYLKMTGFVSTVEDSGPTVAGAMAFLANTDVMIIDLRENHGGSPGVVQLLASYFFSGDRPVHLNDVAMRKRGTKEYDARQWWVLPNVPRPRYVDKEVYILTSRNTPSAAEEFTYDLQALKRATVVGETTWGGANPVGPWPIGQHFVAAIPAGRSINPVTHTNWEGVGVKPDIEVPAEKALSMAHRTALEHLISKAMDEQEAATLKRALAAIQ